MNIPFLMLVAIAGLLGWAQYDSGASTSEMLGFLTVLTVGFFAGKLHELG